MCEKYYSELKIFKNLADELNQNGGAYFVVIANHELYRFLYPYEPYLDFYNKNPVEFITKKIISLNKFLKVCLDTVDFYDFNLHRLKGGSKIISNSSSLEQNTSNLYTSLWNQLNKEIILDESKELLEKRLSKVIIENHIKDKIVLDMGCGSGRYSIALSLLGASKVYAVDLFEQSYQQAYKIAEENILNIEFLEGNFHELPFENEKFDFVFSNGTVHHSTSIKKSLLEYKRVLKKDHYGFLYIYADKGIFWNTRKVMREIFKNIPAEYTNIVLNMMGMPSNRFIFSDVWHVPIEKHTSRKKLEDMLDDLSLSYEKIISNNSTDLDYAVGKFLESDVMWGDGEHRYIIHKKDKQ